MEAQRAEWLRRLAEAARGAAEELRALDDPVLHRRLIDDLDTFRERLAAELGESNPTGRDVER